MSQYPNQPPVPEQLRVPEQPRAPKQLRVFVVDDEDVIASSLAMILRFQGGIHATSFTDPLKALEAVHAEVPDLLITDVVMPQMSGIDLAIQLRDICPDCKVLLFSGQAATADLLEAARAVGYTFDLLLKPVHPADLLASIRSLTGGAQTLSPREPQSGL
ncbi:MAG: response regulator transcription factor [Terracidiphilus sp.]